jgi:hypothetical protein
MTFENSYKVTVLQSKTITRADGQVAVMLDTKELGAISLRIDRPTIEALRINLAQAESLLSASRRSA